MFKAECGFSNTTPEYRGGYQGIWTELMKGGVQCIQNAHVNACSCTQQHTNALLHLQADEMF